MDKLGERIYTLRKQAGLSQEDLAHRTGVSRQTISKWESGAMVPELFNLHALCTLFGVSADYLLFGVNTQSVDEKKEIRPAEIPATSATQASQEQDSSSNSAQKNRRRYKHTALAFLTLFCAISVFFSVFGACSVGSYMATINAAGSEGIVQNGFLLVPLSPSLLMAILVFLAVMFTVFTVLIFIALLKSDKF